MKNPKILVPLDFSELSEQALITAASLAERLGGTVTPFHAYIPVTDLDGFYYVGSGISHHEKYTEIENVLRARLEETARKAVPSGLLTGSLLDVGNPARAILYNAEKYDLVVMGTHGRTGFSRFIIGSVTEKILRLCRKPVITVTAKSSLGNLASLLVTTDFSDNAQCVFPFASHIARVAGATIHLVHIISDEQLFGSSAAGELASRRKKDLRETADHFFHQVRDQVSIDVVTGNRAPHLEITDLAKRVGHDMVFISAAGHSGLGNYMMGSTASQVIRRINKVVFSVNPQGISPQEAEKMQDDS